MMLVSKLPSRLLHVYSSVSTEAGKGPVALGHGIDAFQLGSPVRMKPQSFVSAPGRSASRFGMAVGAFVSGALPFLAGCSVNGEKPGMDPLMDVVIYGPWVMAAAASVAFPAVLFWDWYKGR